VITGPGREPLDQYWSLDYWRQSIELGC